MEDYIDTDNLEAATKKAKRYTIIIGGTALAIAAAVLASKVNAYNTVKNAN